MTYCDSLTATHVCSLLLEKPFRMYNLANLAELRTKLETTEQMFDHWKCKNKQTAHSDQLTKHCTCVLVWSLWAPQHADLGVYCWALLHIRSSLLLLTEPDESQGLSSDPRCSRCHLTDLFHTLNTGPLPQSLARIPISYYTHIQGRAHKRYSWTWSSHTS